MAPEIKTKRAFFVTTNSKYAAEWIPTNILEDNLQNYISARINSSPALKDAIYAVIINNPSNDMSCEFVEVLRQTSNDTATP